MNVERCPVCNKDFIAEEFESHKCERRVRPYEKVVTLYYSTFIPLKIDGRDVALLTSEDGKTLYNIKPSPVAGHSTKSPEDGTEPKISRSNFFREKRIVNLERKTRRSD